MRGYTRFPGVRNCSTPSRNDCARITRPRRYRIEVQFRIDWPAWLATLTGRDRRMIRVMAKNESTISLSRQFDLSPARISQKRREFHDDWHRFCDGADQAVTTTV